MELRIVSVCIYVVQSGIWINLPQDCGVLHAGPYTGGQGPLPPWASESTQLSWPYCGVVDATFVVKV